ncbi:MAG: tetratricopeptide repeat protein [Candidatus Aminicenantales bacterium]|jgi:tetratricopeptide (TPR) repeat protein
MKKMTGFLSILSLILTLAACAPSRKVVTVEVTDPGLKTRQAASFVDKGHYLAFKRAVLIYGELYGNRAMRPKIATPYLEASLLLALREKEIGLDNPATIAAAERLLQENPMLAGLGPWVTLISAIPPRTRGVMRDIDTRSWGKAGQDALKAAEESVRKSAATDKLSACVLAAWSCSFGRYSEKWRNPAELMKIYPDSLLMKYEIAICGEGRPDLLEEILAKEPEFAEAHYHLGETALKSGRLLDAEAHLLKAYEAIPESPQTRILLAGIYFATEEFDKSLEFYDLSLQVSPEYRDALLGKAICLSYLGRYEDAIPPLDRMLELGYWLLGEAHYWLAWNLHELKRDAEALRHVDEAKGRLPTNSEVFGLSGTISLEMGELDRAEKDFLESLKYNPANSESLFGLGTVAGRKNLWEESGSYYEKAGRAFESAETTLQAKVEEIKGSALSGERKARLLRKRELQLERVRLTGATAYYDAAAAYINAGLKDKAIPPAAKSAAHPALKDKTEELLRSIRK